MSVIKIVKNESEEGKRKNRITIIKHNYALKKKGGYLKLNSI